MSNIKKKTKEKFVTTINGEELLISKNMNQVSTKLEM